MIDIVNAGLDRASTNKTICRISFDNGVFTFSDKTRFPDTCIIEQVKYKDGVAVPNQYWIFRIFGIEKTLLGTLNTDNFDYSQKLEITHKSIGIGCLFIEFERNIF
jgi:hypothetical protein